NAPDQSEAGCDRTSPCNASSRFAVSVVTIPSPQTREQPALLPARLWNLMFRKTERAGRSAAAHLFESNSRSPLFPHRSVAPPLWQGELWPGTTRTTAARL